MHLLKSQTLKFINVAIFISLLPGCIALDRNYGVFAEVPSNLKTSSAVTEKYGEPLKKSTDGKYEIWHYFLIDNGIDNKETPITEHSFNAVFLIIPLWLTFHYEDNAIFIFLDGAIVKAIERVEQNYGFGCGFFAFYTVAFECNGSGRSVEPVSPWNGKVH